MANFVKTIEVSQQLRPCEVEVYNKKQKGLFHKWVETDEQKNSSTVMRNCYGLVELADGRVFRIKPLYIRFLDSKEIFENYCFEGEGHEEANKKDVV